MMQVIGDMPALPKPTMTEFVFPTGIPVNHCKVGICLETQTNCVPVSGNDLRNNQRSQNNG